MKHSLQRIEYERLNARQKESYNFQKISAVLADFGYVTIRLSDDWKGADFLAQHIGGHTLRVQLKSRLMLAKTYLKKDLWITFRRKDTWFLFPHDEIVKVVLKKTKIGKTRSWAVRGRYSFPKISKQMQGILKPYQIMQEVGANKALQPTSQPRFARLVGDVGAS